MHIRFAEFVDAVMGISVLTYSARCVQEEIANLRQTVVKDIPVLTRNVLNEIEVDSQSGTMTSNKSLIYFFFPYII